MYGNPYLRTGSSALPPLPPPSTANPAATPAPPPYHAPRNHGSHTAILKNFSSVSGGILNCGGNGISTNGPVSVSGSSSNLTSSSNTLPATPLAPPTAITPTSLTTATAATAATVTAAVIAASQHPSGQFILPPSNGNVAKKGALATHV